MGWAEDFKDFKLEVKTNSLQVTKKILIDLARAIIRSTPVDTGRAKGNWQYSAGSQIQEISLDDKSGNVATAKIIEQVALISEGDLERGESFYIGNNLDYIEGLEYGDSKQSPQGMLRINVAKFNAFVRKNAGALNI